MLSSSCTEQLEKQSPLNFSEKLAKFTQQNGRTIDEEDHRRRRSRGSIKEQQNGINEMDESLDVLKSVAEKKKIFESSHQSDSQISRPSLSLKPHREAPPPPPRSIPVENKDETWVFLPPMLSQTEDDCQNGEENGEARGVKDMIEKFNKIGPRIFGPDILSASSNYIGTQSKLPSLGRLKEKDESEADLAQEAGTYSEQEEENQKEEEEGEGEERDYNHNEEDGTSNDTMAKRQSSFGGKESTLHRCTEEILNEMRKQGLFRKNAIAANLPGDIGSIRSKKVRQRDGIVSDPPKSMLVVINEQQNGRSSLAIPSVTSSAIKRRRKTGPIEQECTTKTNSMASSCSSSTTMDECCSYEMPAIPQYETGDEKEDKRLRELHAVAIEFYQVQCTYVDVLQQIGINYPGYLEECKKRSQKDCLVQTGTSSSNSSPHVVKRITAQFELILGVHKMFLEEISAKLAKWDSRKPDMAEIFQRKADFLKICNTFLKDKRTLAAEFQQALEENKDLAYVTRKFEEGMNEEECVAGAGGGVGNAMNMKGISILMQLDAVHQNVVRYKLLMERYRKYLPENLVESKIADEALKKLTAVSNTVNEFLTGAEADNKLLELHRKLQGIFDVCAPGRKLIHEGELRRQTRKELQLRYLILFSDMLLICRYSGTLGVAADYFDAANVYIIPIEKVRLNVDEHEDYEQEFIVQSPKKSSAFVAKTKRERDQWVKRISEAIRTAKESRIERKKYSKLGHELEGLQPAAGKRSNISKGSQPKEEGKPVECEGEEEEEDEMGKHLEINCNGKAKEMKVGMGINNNHRHRSNNSQQNIVNSSTTAGLPPNDTTGIFTRPKHWKRRILPIWIPDEKATKCLMAGCDTRFSILRRKHHCRQCGWLICTKCVGEAPVPVKEWQKSKVCPECFRENRNEFEQGTLFPAKMINKLNQLASSPGSPHPPSTPSASSAQKEIADLIPQSNGQLADANSREDSAQPKFPINDSSIRISYFDGISNFFVSPMDLFTAPINANFLKALIPTKAQPLITGKVYLRNRKGVPTLRWARLTQEYFLQFYEAEYDDQPSESYFIYAYSVAYNETEDGIMVIELSHRNQIQTDRKEDQIVFHVLHSKSAEKWLEKLHKILAIEESLDQEEEEEDEEGKVEEEEMTTEGK